MIYSESFQLAVNCKSRSLAFNNSIMLDSDFVLDKALQMRVGIVKRNVRKSSLDVLTERARLLCDPSRRSKEPAISAFVQLNLMTGALAHP